MDEVLQKLFSGERILQNFGKCFLKFGGILNSDFPRGGGVWGGIRAGKTKNLKQKIKTSNVLLGVAGLWSDVLPFLLSFDDDFRSDRRFGEQSSSV